MTLLAAAIGAFEGLMFAFMGCIVDWLAGDLTRGDPADDPLPRSFDGGWLIGNAMATPWAGSRWRWAPVSWSRWPGR